MKCPKCGHKVDYRKMRCPHCGASLKVEREATRLKRFGALAVVAILLAGSIVFVIGARGLEGNPFRSGNQMLESAARANSNESTASVSSASTESAVSTPEETDAEGSISSETENTKSATEELTAELTDDHDIMDLSGYAKAAVKSAEATSVMPANDGSNIYRAESACDGDEVTSWQEGERGDGIGSTLTMHLDREYSIRYLILKLGNWRSDNLYQANNRPQTLSIMMGDESVQVTFPDEKKAFCVKLSRDVKASDVTFRVDSVYSGTKYDDTCIAEIEVDGF